MDFFYFDGRFDLWGIALEEYDSGGGGTDNFPGFGG